MATTAERLGIVETKVAVLDEKIDTLRTDVKDVHDCLDRTRDGIMEQLKTMHQSSCEQHNELAGKIKELEKFRMKWTWMVAGGVATLGVVSGHLDKLLHFFH